MVPASIALDNQLSSKDMPLWLMLLLALLLPAPQPVMANVPKFFVDSKMALVLVPSDVPINTTVYRVKASDSDAHYPLTFLLPDGVGRGLLTIRPYPCGTHSRLCEADMVLRRPLVAGQTSTFRLRVRDSTGETTTVVGKVKATQGTSRDEETFIGASDIVIKAAEAPLARTDDWSISGIECMKGAAVDIVLNGTLDFEAENLVEFSVFAEDTKMGTVLRTISAIKGKRNINFDLRRTNKLVLRNSRLTRKGAAVDIVLNGTLDFEAENLVEFSVFAEDGYRDLTVDTRNIMEMKMNLLVRDVQDTPPFFTSTKALFRVKNNAQPGDVIGTFHAEDGDRQNPREIHYRLIPNGLGYDSYFSMDPTSGNLSVTSSLTGLLTSQLEPMTVTVSAEEVTLSLAERGQTAQRDVVVIREDGAHQAPQFRQRLYETQLFENPALGTLLNFPSPLETTGQRGSFTLSIVGDLASKCFEVDPAIQTREGQFNLRVKNNQLLDFEKLPNPVMVFSVKAEEVDTGSRRGRLLSSLANISVTILDQNDNPPVFEKSLYRASFKENAVRGTSILRVSATDPDQSDAGQITYIRLTGDNSADLNLDPGSGVISIKVNAHDFDFEKQEDYQLKVYAVDSGRPQLTGTASIVLTVLDFNDHPPVFTAPLYNGKLDPDGASFEKPLRVHAEDADSGSNSKITYRLVGGGKWLNHFSIDRRTGEMRVKLPVSMGLTEGPDSERDSRGLPYSEPYTIQKTGNDRVEDRIELEVQAQDDGDPQQFSNVPVHIYRKDNVQTTMTFLVKEDVRSVERNRAGVEKQLSVFTGGTAEIINIEPYEQDGDQISGQQRAASTVITAKVTRPYNAIYNTTGLNSGNNNNGGNGNEDDGPVVQATINNVWFWLLICLALLIIIIIIIGCCCYYCAFCYTCCPLISCYKGKQLKDYDEEGVAYVGIDDSSRIRSQGGRSGMLHQMRRTMSGNAQRVRSATNNAWQGNGHYRTLPGGRRNSQSSTIRLVEAPGDDPGRDHVVLARQEMEDEVSRVMLNARGARDSQIILVPNEIGSLHRSSSRASRGGPKMYRVVRGDGRGPPMRGLDGGEDGYQLEDLEDEELQRLELERQSVIMPNSRRSPSVEVLTLNENNGRDAEYRHHGNSESLRLHTSARPRRREFFVDKDGNEIERPTYRGRPRDDSDVQYGVDSLRLSGRAVRRDRHHRTRSEVLVLHEEDGEEEGDVGEERGMDDGGGGRAMIMKRFINSQEGGRLEESDPHSEAGPSYHHQQQQEQQLAMAGVSVTSQRRSGDVTEAEAARLSVLGGQTPIQEETLSVLEWEDREERRRRAAAGEGPSSDLSVSRQYRRQRSRSQDPEHRRDLPDPPQGRRRSTDEGEPLRRDAGPVPIPGRLTDSRPGSQLSLQFSSHMLNNNRQQRIGSAGSQGRQRRGRTRTNSQERRFDGQEVRFERREEDRARARHRDDSVGSRWRHQQYRDESAGSYGRQKNWDEEQGENDGLNHREDKRGDRRADRHDDRYGDRRDDQREDRRENRREDRREDRRDDRRETQRGDRREGRREDRGEYRREDRREYRRGDERDDRRNHGNEDYQVDTREERRQDGRDDRDDRRRGGSERYTDDDHGRRQDREMRNEDYRRSDDGNRRDGYDGRNEKEMREKDDTNRRNDQDSRARDGDAGRSDRNHEGRNGDNRRNDREGRDRYEGDIQSDGERRRSDGKGGRSDGEERRAGDRNKGKDNEGRNGQNNRGDSAENSRDEENREGGIERRNVDARRKDDASYQREVGDVRRHRDYNRRDSRESERDSDRKGSDKDMKNNQDRRDSNESRTGGNKQGNSTAEDGTTEGGTTRSKSDAGGKRNDNHDDAEREESDRRGDHRNDRADRKENPHSSKRQDGNNTEGRRGSDGSNKEGGERRGRESEYEANLTDRRRSDDSQSGTVTVQSRRGSDGKRSDAVSTDSQVQTGKSVSSGEDEQSSKSHPESNRSSDVKKNSSKEMSKEATDKRKGETFNVDMKSTDEKSKSKDGKMISKQKSQDSTTKEAGKTRDKGASEGNAKLRQQDNKSSNKTSSKTSTEAKKSSRDDKSTVGKKTNKDEKAARDSKAGKHVKETNDKKTSKASPTKGKTSKSDKDDKNKSEQATSNSKRSSNTSNQSQEKEQEKTPSTNAETTTETNHQHLNAIDATHRTSDIADLAKQTSAEDHRPSDISGVHQHQSDISDGVSGDSGFSDVNARPPGEEPSAAGGDVRPFMADDTGSNISSTLVPGVRKKRNQFLEKKSIFTIAYDDVHTHRLRSDTPHEADV